MISFQLFQCVCVRDTRRTLLYLMALCVQFTLKWFVVVFVQFILTSELHWPTTRILVNLQRLHIMAAFLQSNCQLSQINKMKIGTILFINTERTTIAALCEHTPNNVQPTIFFVVHLILLSALIEVCNVFNHILNSSNFVP